MDDLGEARKWLRLGYETYGPAGARAVAAAMGLQLFPSTTSSNWPILAATDSSDTVATNDAPQLPIHRGPPRPAPRQTSKLACPTTPPRNAPGWRSYNDTGDPNWFHCGFEGYLEDRDPSPDAPIAECFYDQDGRLVDDKHPYAGCKGTPDSYSASDRWNHIFNDPGGVAQAGIPAFLESIQHAGDEMVRKRKEALERMGYPVYGIGPFRAPRPR